MIEADLRRSFAIPHRFWYTAVYNAKYPGSAHDGPKIQTHRPKTRHKVCPPPQEDGPALRKTQAGKKEVSFVRKPAVRPSKARAFNIFTDHRKIV